MWEFIYQNIGIILLIGLMFFMHRPGAGGCGGGGHQHDSQKTKDSGKDSPIAGKEVK